MLVKVILAFLIFYALFTLVPCIYYKYIYKEGYEKGHLYLTFDDGPNRYVTEEVLDILKENQKKATFFVVGEKILENKDIILRAYSEGHEIGVHCFNHSNPLLWGPIKTKIDMDKSLGLLKDLNIRPSFYRPPHGIVNLMMVYKASKEKLPLKLWTCLPGDWKDDLAYDKILEALKKEKEKGGVVCLHDSNHKIKEKTKANENTLKALKEYFKKEEIYGKLWKKATLYE